MINFQQLDYLIYHDNLIFLIELFFQISNLYKNLSIQSNCHIIIIDVMMVIVLIQILFKQILINYHLTLNV